MKKRPWYKKYFWYGIFWSILSIFILGCTILNIVNKNYMALPICVFAFGVDTTNAISHLKTYTREKAYDKESNKSSKIE